MIKGTTGSGFEFAIPKENFDDYEALELLYKIDHEGDNSVIVALAPLILGEEQLKNLKEHIKEKYGKVRISAMVVELSDIFNSSKDVKN